MVSQTAFERRSPPGRKLVDLWPDKAKNKVAKMRFDGGSMTMLGCAVRSIAALDDDDPCWPPSLHIPLEAAGATRAGGRRGRGGKSRRRVPSIPVVGPEDVIAAAAKTYALMCAPSLLRDCDGLDGDGGVDGER